MYLGIELGSTRIKGVILNQQYETVASASFHWKTSLDENLWTYALDEAWLGLRQVIQALKTQIPLEQVKSIGISAMMHGHLAFNHKDELLVPFRTWKNVNTEKAAVKLSTLFNFNIPLRWSIAHLYQAILDKEKHVKDVTFITTLAGYIHWQLTNQKVIGIGDASGMFPIDSKTKTYHENMVNSFNQLTNINILDFLPDVKLAGEDAGYLTQKGVELLGKDSGLSIGIPLCAPEGDAQTGMVSTHAIKPKTGNVSAGTSVFMMIVLSQALKKWYPLIDIVTTPVGDNVAMVHANECTSRIDPWIERFGEALSLFGAKVDRNDLFTKLYEYALNNNSPLSQFMYEKLQSAIIDLKEGIDILINDEKIEIDYLKGHGGYFESGMAGQTIMSQTLGIPIQLFKNAGQGGPWGTAVLAAYRYMSLNQKVPFQTFIDEIFKGE